MYLARVTTRLRLARERRRKQKNDIVPCRFISLAFLVFPICEREYLGLTLSKAGVHKSSLNIDYLWVQSLYLQLAMN
jgi:hypothetical protein